MPVYSSMRHTVVISDIHLCELEPTDGLWMRYRQAPYSPDREIAAMLDALRDEVRRGVPDGSRGAEHALTLVLNGDVFDFDAPRVVGNESVFHDLPRTAEHAVPAVKAILRDHPVFVSAIGEVIADGHTVVFVAGNHDIQLALPEVREVVTGALVDAAGRVLAERGGAPQAASAARLRRELAARVVFRAWFHKTPDGIIVEHGNQYDSYCAYRYPMAPFGRNPGEIQPTMGSLVSRLLVSRMGYFNPHVDGSFMLSGVGYLAHWARYYLFSKRSLVLAYALGALKTVVELVRRRYPERRALKRACLVAAARETGAPLRAVAKHARLFARPAEDCLGRVARELWLDRAALLGLVLLVAGLWLLVATGPLASGALLSPALLVAYECCVPKPRLDAVWRGVNLAARQVARAHAAKAVVFGHTHAPEGSWEDGAFFGNTGSWSAAFEDIECTKPVFAARPLVWLRSEVGADAEVRLLGGLFKWQDSRFLPWTTNGRPPVAPKAEVARRKARPALRPQATAALRG